MYTNRWYRSLLAFAGCALLLLTTACGPTSPPTPVQSPQGSATVTASATAGSTPTSSSKPTTPVSGGASTVSMPATQTSCPQPQAVSGRAAVMRPLALGSHPSIAYIFNEGTADTPSIAELKRYDVTTGSKTVIVHLPQTNISSAQVSADGQWLLFVSDVFQPGPSGGVAQLQLVRMDGQGLQTLFCAPRWSVQGVQWSPDQQFIVFSTLLVPGNLRLSLLNLAMGTVQTELSSTDPSYGYLARTWPNNTWVYVVGVPVNTRSPEESLYLLDTGKGPNQNQQDLQQVLPPTQPAYCWDFDSDYEATRLVTSECTVSLVNGTEDEKENATMSTPPFDPARYKAGQRWEWDTAAPRLKDWGQFLLQQLQPVSERMMELADIGPGSRVLDVATGGGEPAVTAAHRGGSSGYVIATDLSPQMVALGRERVAELGLHNIDFREMDAEAPDLPEHSFDVILSRFGLMMHIDRLIRTC
jgi:hypothetical protein